MATLNQIIQSLADDLDQSFDFTVKEKLKHDFINWRSTFLRRDQYANRTISENVVQSLGCVEMEKVPKDESCDDCVIWRTKKEIPKPLRLKSFSVSPFVYVGSKTGMESFGYVRPEEADFIKHQKYTYKMPRYTYKNNRIYVYNSTAEKILIRGVFEDPREVAHFNDCDQVDCYTDDDQFPIPADMIPLIIQTMLKEQLSTDNTSQEEVRVNEQ